jgi:outer membrane protein assembly factor BamB
MRAATAVVLVALLAGCGGAGVAAPASHDRPASDWAAPNADLSNTRRTGGPIDAASVSQLKVAWTLPWASAAATPIVVGGVLYAQDLSSNVSAIELSSGSVLWRRRYEEPDVGPNGVSVGDGRVYGATETRAFALSARTGAQLWSRRLVRNAHEGIDMAPGYDRGTVYVSTVPANGKLIYGAGGRGVLWALDGASGRPRWRWAEVPADLWGRPDVNAGGGLWHPPAFDARGQLYVGTANPAPFPGTRRYPWGASRPGPNRWTDAIVKLDARTGRPVWARQVLPHDLYDWDLEDPVILARVRGRTVALAAGKMGFVYAFDAATGRLLWKRAVGVHNGHDHDDLLAMHGDVRRLRSPITVLPGQLGGVLTPMAIDDSSVYVPVNDLQTTYDAHGAVEVENPLTGTGELVALDLTSGRVRWDRRLPHVDFGAATVANDVVFTTTYDGRVWALSTRSGRVLWTAALPAATNAPLVVAGGTLIAQASVVLGEGQRLAMIAYRLKR